MTAPSKMNNPQLRTALAEAKQDVKNTGSYWKGHCDERDIIIGKLTDKCTKLECTIERQSSIIRRRNDEIHELGVKNKCLVDELAKLNSDLKDVQTISDSVKMDCNLWPIDPSVQQYALVHTQATTDANAEIKAVQSVLDSANAKVDELEARVKNQSETILRMAGQMFGGDNGG